MTDETTIVFIGGLGGSGTRVVARTVAGLGFYPGGCLNASNDNLIFTELFKRPAWLRSAPPESAIRDRLTLFKRVMCEGIGRGTVEAWPRLSRFAARQGRGLAGQPEALGWMTKEPNCHIFIESILNLWAKSVFVYVARHPLDMAFSRNRAQLGNWGWIFNLQPSDFAAPEAAQLEFWIRAQRRIEGLMDHYSGRIYCLRFEAFAERPEHELGILIDALGLPVPRGRIADACTGVVRPASVGRYRHRDLSQFGRDQLGFCRASGWPIRESDRS
jgi:hypothetical protein